jgi:ribonuclease HII
MQSPTFELENNLKKQGYKYIAGIDEAGRGPLAGPVVAAAAMVNREFGMINCKIRDSKLLSLKQREKLFKVITKNALAWGVGKVSEKIIDQRGIVQANLLAVKKAIKSLKIKPDYLLFDGGIKLENIKIPQKTIIKGDAKIFSIACASILAKVTRDRFMVKLDKKYPQYGFAQHKGYGTKTHFEAIKKYGPCPIHRKSFAPVSSL